MGMFLTTTLILALLYLIVKQAVRSFHDGKMEGADHKSLLFVLIAEMIGIVVVMLSEEGSFYEVMTLISFGTFSCYLMVLSFVSKRLVRVLKTLIIIFQFLYVAYRTMSLYWGLPVISLSCSLNLTLSVPLLISFIYAASLAARIADAKFVLKSGAVWNSVCMVTDIVYIMFLLLYVSAYYLIIINLSEASMWICLLCSILLISLQYAVSVRINTASLFVFWEEHERRFVESMRLNHNDFTGESPGIDVLYRNIYDRIIDYFENHRPYLNHELTVNDIVNVLYTNKLYISKAINMYTGRNFCQFVNYYRITYAVDLFRKDTTLKIVDVASRSGFNSPVSFSMAFRLYKGEKPSDWFRRERVRLSKRKK